MDAGPGSPVTPPVVQRGKFRVSMTLGTETQALSLRAGSFNKDLLSSRRCVKYFMDILGTEKEHLIPGRLRGSQESPRLGKDMDVLLSPGESMALPNQPQGQDRKLVKLLTNLDLRW